MQHMPSWSNNTVPGPAPEELHVKCPNAQVSGPIDLVFDTFVDFCSPRGTGFGWFFLLRDANFRVSNWRWREFGGKPLRGCFRLVRGLNSPPFSSPSNSRLNLPVTSSPFRNGVSSFSGDSATDPRDTADLGVVFQKASCPLYSRSASNAV